MKKAETAVSRQPRRVGTFTLGLVLVSAGILMALSLFCPQLDLTWALKASPAILVALGTETLIAAHGAEHIKYDWVGMILCLVLVCAALCLYGISWWLMYGAAYGGCL